MIYQFSYLQIMKTIDIEPENDDPEHEIKNLRKTSKLKKTVEVKKV